MQSSFVPLGLTAYNPDATRSDQTSFYPTRIDLTRTRHASHVLAAFSPRAQPRGSYLPGNPSPIHNIKMSQERGLRQLEKVTYAISDDSDELASQSGTSSMFSTPPKKRRHNIVDLGDDDEVVEVQRPRTPPPRLSSAGHSLRQHQDLRLSFRAQMNGDKHVIKRRKLSRSKSQHSKPRLLSDFSPAPLTRTVRNETRDYIATETAKKRARFFVANKDCFLPLLPESNHVKKLVESETQQTGGASSGDNTIPYVAIATQPVG